EWYNSHKADYLLPERRTIRYVVFGPEAIKSVPAPTDAEIAARYNAVKATRFAPTDKRKLSQLVLPTEAAAKQVMAEIQAGKSLEASAAAKGLAVASLGSLGKAEYALQSSDAAANAIFSGPTGKVTGPYKAPLGWLLVRVDGLDGSPGKTLDQARAELVKELTEEKRAAAIAEFSAAQDDRIANGATLTDLAKELNLPVQETPPLTADGGVFGKPGMMAPEQLAPIVKAAYGMDQAKQPQLTQLVPGKTFILFDVGTLTPAAAPPLAEIRPQVITDIQLSKGAKLAKAAADKVKAQLEKGVPIDVAIASLGMTLPPIDRVDKARAEVQAQGQNAAKPEMLLFSMAKGKVRLLAAPRNRGWYVVTVSEVTAGKVAPEDPRLVGLQADLQNSVGSEYAGQLRYGMRTTVGTTRNEANTKQLKKQLEGSK
ncbi:MAG TPA: peptidylprolyl isomerase, partial [Novosphingobium sp.]|nr:peptidylprolyl isomerase [Novosphingobium sp.]